MNVDVLERALELMSEAKRELILVEASKSTAKALEEAYASLTASEKAIMKLLVPSNPSAS